MAAALGAFAVSGGLLAILVSSWPFAAGLVVGAYLGVLTVMLLVLLAIADGSVLPRLGRAFEGMVGDELDKAPGVLAVVSGVSFAHRDVDHVVLARGGCFAVEVKASFGRRNGRGEVPDLDSKLAQTRNGARQIELLLASRGVPLPVSPLLILAGSGAPDMAAIGRYGDVLVGTLRNSDAWRSALMGLDSHHLDEVTARTAAAELSAFCQERTGYELANPR